MTTTDETPLHVQQAEGLHRLADAVASGADMSYGMQYLVENLTSVYVSFDGPARENLTAFATGMRDAGADVEVRNEPENCTVIATFGVLKVQKSASAKEMASESPVAYEPLVLPS
ncbi:hypothetical protein GCM10027258_63110 [Amycolatopsis stemonae]